MNVETVKKLRGLLDRYEGLEADCALIMDFFKDLDLEPLNAEVVEEISFLVSTLYLLKRKLTQTIDTIED